MVIATLSIDLVAQLAQLQQGLDKAGRLAEKNAAQIEARYAKMAAAATAVGAALGGAISVAGITAFVRATVDGIDKLNDLSDATGASIENLSALEDIGARTGTSIDTVGDAVLKLNKVLSDAKPGSDQAKALALLGLSAEELKRQDPAEAVRQVAVALAGFTDDGNKARIVQELFGKSTKEVAAFLKDLAGAGSLNATVTTQQAKEAERFNQQLAAMAKNSQDAARAIAADLLPELSKFIAAFGQLGQLKEIGFSTLFGETLKGNTFRDAGAGVIFYADKLKDLQAQRAAIAADPNPVARRGGLQDIDDEIAKIEKLQGFYRTLYKIQAPDNGQSDPRELARRGRLAGLKDIGDLPGDPAKHEKVKPFVSNSFDQGLISALKELDKTDAAKLRDLNEQLSALFDLQRETRGDPAVVQAIANVKAEIAGIGPEAKKAADEKKRLDAILAATPQGILQDVLTDIELINRAFDNGAQDTEKWAAAIRVAVGKLPQETEKALEEISEFSREASRNIQDAIGDSLVQMMDGNAKSIGDIWVNMLKRMVAQAAAAKLAESLFGEGYGSSTSKVGGLFGQLFNGSSGNTMFGSRGSFTSSGNQDFGGFFAAGGYLGAGKWGIAGERGPEVIKGPAQVVPTGGSQGSTQVVQINVAGDVSERNVKLIERAIANERARSMRAY